MRYTTSITASLLAVAALASPLAKRDIVTETDIDIVYETVYVTETADAIATSTAATTTLSTAVATAVSSVSAIDADQYGFSGAFSHHRHWDHGASSTVLSTVLSTGAITSSASSTPASLTPLVPYTTAIPSTTSTTSVASPKQITSTTSTVIVAYSSTSISSSVPVTTAAVPPAANSYQAAVLAHHNVHRTNHSAPNIAWSDSLAAIALAEASVCVYAHNTTGGGGGYGQNIAAGVSADNITATITDLFYNGEVNWYNGLYGQANPDFTNFEHWGHFSQIVWKATTQVGCATVNCGTGGLAGVSSDVAPIFTVCNYSPPGNMGGGYGDNVGSPLGEATVDWNYTG